MVVVELKEKVKMLVEWCRVLVMWSFELRMRVQWKRSALTDTMFHCGWGSE